MAKFLTTIGGVSLFLIISGFPATGAPLSDDQIRQQIIHESIESYPGNCPCPYNLARNGSRCGKRSAYSKPGGYSPLCYPGDVTDENVKAYRREHDLPR